MGYDEPRFIAQNVSKEFVAVGTATGTFTASDHVLTSTPSVYSNCVTAAILTGAAATVQVAGVSKSPTLYILQGANIATSFGTSHTLGAVAVATALTNTVTFSAGEAVIIKVVHTGTASATQVAPVYSVSLRFREQFT